MKEFVLILLLTSSTTSNGPSMISGFTSKEACNTAAGLIMAEIGGLLPKNSASMPKAQHSCVEILK